MELLRIMLVTVHAVSGALWTGAAFFFLFVFSPITRSFRDYDFFISLRSIVINQAMQYMLYSFSVSLVSGAGLFILYRRSLGNFEYASLFSAKMLLIMLAFFLIRNYIGQTDRVADNPDNATKTGVLVSLSGVFILAFLLPLFP